METYGLLAMAAGLVCFGAALWNLQSRVETLEEYSEGLKRIADAAMIAAGTIRDLRSCSARIGQLRLRVDKIEAKLEPPTAPTMEPGDVHPFAPDAFITSPTGTAA